MAKKKNSNSLNNKAAPYLFILPWFVGFILFTAGPLIMSLVMSFFDWPVIGSPKFVGWDNYAKTFTGDPQFWKSMSITFKFTLIFVPLNLILALLMALVISKIYLLPQALE